MFRRATFQGLSLLFATVLLSAQSDASATDAPAFEAPQSFGTAAGYTTMMGYDLVRGAFAPLEWHLGATFCEDGFGDANVPSEGYARLRFPEGATLSQLQFWAYDTNSTYGLNVSLYETCQAVGAGPQVTTQIGSADTFGAIGHYFGFTPLNNRRVNNRDCAYTVRVQFNPGTLCLGSQLSIQKVHVSWFRGVSPPPATATFSDVPTTHTLFPYVEALVKAGVTGGCGANNFCPNAALTRGQMAVFLARALGLQWP